MLKDRLFFVLCVVYSISCAIGFATSRYTIAGIVIAIFLWIVYSKSRKDTVDVESMRIISGAIFANYILNYLMVAGILLAGSVASLAISAIKSNAELLNPLLDMLRIIFPSAARTVEFIRIVPTEIIVAIIFLVALAVLLINVIFYRRVHRLAKLTYKSIQKADELIIKDTKSITTGLLAFTIISGVQALFYLSSFNLTGFLIEGGKATTYALAILLTKKYISTEA